MRRRKSLHRLPLFVCRGRKTVSPFPSKIGRLILGANYQYADREIPIDAGGSGFEGFVNKVNFSELRFFTGIRL